MCEHEVLQKYGDYEIHFKSYYKYQFTYFGFGLTVTVGAIHEDIYRFNALPKMRIRDLLDLAHVEISKGEEAIFERHDW